MKVTEILSENTDKPAFEFELPKGFVPYNGRVTSTITKFEVKGDKFGVAVSFYKNKGWKVTDMLAPGATMRNWGAHVYKLKSPTPGYRLEIIYDEHRKYTYLEFKRTKK